MECAFGLTDFFDLLDEGFDFVDVRILFGAFLFSVVIARKILMGESAESQKIEIRLFF